MFGSNWEGANLQWGETISYPNILFILFSLLFIERLLSDFFRQLFYFFGLISDLKSSKMSTASKNKAIASDEEDEGEDENSEGESDDEEWEGKGKSSPDDGRRWHLR